MHIMLTPLREGHSVVILGSWNPRIFTGEWVTKNVPNTVEVGLAVAVGNPHLPWRLEFGGVHLHVGDDRLLLTPVQSTDVPSLQRLFDVGSAIVTILNHTPVTAVGVNFKFEEKAPPKSLLAAFEIGDQDVLSDVGTKWSTTIVRRAIEYDEESLNLILEFRKDSTVTLECNFHRTADTPAEILEHLSKGADHYQKIATQLLSNAYYSEVLAPNA